MGSGLVLAGADESHEPGVLVQIGLHGPVVGELDRPLVCMLGLLVSCERRCTLRGAHEHLSRVVADPGGVLVVRRRTVGIEVVRREHLDDLLVVPQRRQVFGCCEVQRLALLPGQGVVRDFLHEVLEEAVLPTLG